MFCSKNINSNYSSRQLKCSLTTMLIISQQTSETFSTICHLSINRFIFDPKINFPPKGTLDTWIVFLTPKPHAEKICKSPKLFWFKVQKKLKNKFQENVFWWNFLWKARPLKTLLPKSATFSINLRKNLNHRFVRSKKTFSSLKMNLDAWNVMLIGWPNIFLLKSETFLLEIQKSFLKKIHKFIFLSKSPYRHLHNSFDEPVEKR